MTARSTKLALRCSVYPKMTLIASRTDLGPFSRLIYSDAHNTKTRDLRFYGMPDNGFVSFTQHEVFMKTMIHKGAGLAAAVLLAVPMLAQATIFGPVSAQTRQANSGMILGFTETRQNYQEFPPAGAAGVPSPMDSQTGTIPGIEIGYQKQNAHIGWGVAVNVSRGNTTYNGYTQNLQTGALTPATDTTTNGLVGVHGWFNYGFALSAAPNLNFAPGILAGVHAWTRDNSQNPGGYSEGYVNGNYSPP